MTYWNPAAERLYGFARDEVLGRPVADFQWVGAPDLRDVLEGVLAGTPVSFETVHVRNDGVTVQTSLSLSRIFDQAGAVTGVVGIARDIGEQKTRDAEFHEESKLESLGRLSAGLAHEINSPIQFVGDNARFLEEAYQELIRVVEVYRGLLDTSNPIGWMERQERVREAEAGIDFDYLQKEIPSAVAQTLEGIERVSTIVRAMKTFSHPGHTEQVPANLNEALEATVTVIRHQVSGVADLRLELADLPPVRCNIAELNQVFLNLVVNAADAIEETGRRGVITVATAVDGDDVIVRISDTGGGIPDDVRQKIFDPFFTTKDVGRGSGQGLALARGVVHEGHGGSLTLDSVLGQGTTFSVRIPVNGLRQKEMAEADLLDVAPAP
jgi:PAS domain S-box-containing protein